MRFTWANQSERRILVSNSVTCNSFREFHTLDWFVHVWALPWDWRQLRRLHVLKDATQLSCIRWTAPNRSVIWLVTGATVDNGLLRSIMQLILLQHGYCTFVIILFGTFAKLLFNLSMCIRALFPKSSTTLCLVEQAFWRVPLFTERVDASSFEVILAMPSKQSTTATLASGTLGSRCFLASWKVGSIEKHVASLRSRDAIRRQEVWLLQIEVGWPKQERKLPKR